MRMRMYEESSIFIYHIRSVVFAFEGNRHVGYKAISPFNAQFPLCNTPAGKQGSCMQNGMKQVISFCSLNESNEALRLPYVVKCVFKHLVISIIIIIIVIIIIIIIIIRRRKKIELFDQ